MLVAKVLPMLDNLVQSCKVFGKSLGSPMSGFWSRVLGRERENPRIQAYLICPS